MVKPTVGILTTFYELNPSYSLASVVKAQLTALAKYGYKTVLFVHDNFNADAEVPAGVEIRKIVPRFNLVDYSGNQPVSSDFQDQVDKAYKAFKEHTKDIDIILEHDLIFQGWFLPYCVAIHKLADESKIKWFHWTHSVTSAMPRDLDKPHSLRYFLPRNSKLVYLNNFHIVRAAEDYHTFPNNVRVIYNPVDPRLFYNLHPLVKLLIDEYDLLNHDFFQVYPVSTPRMIAGKGLFNLIDIFSYLKKEGKKVKLVIANAHANNPQDKAQIAEAMSYATQKGLNTSDLIFTSLQEPPKYESGIPHEAVSQLFQLSNLFVFPSTSENCSLILLEAMLSKCLLILNNNVGAMREFGKENALYFNFGSIDDAVSYDDKERFMEDVARIIVSEMSTNKALKAANYIKKFFNYDFIFKNQIEPLLYNDEN